MSQPAAAPGTFQSPTYRVATQLDSGTLAALTVWANRHALALGSAARAMIRAGLEKEGLLAPEPSPPKTKR